MDWDPPTSSSRTVVSPTLWYIGRGRCTYHVFTYFTYLPTYLYRAAAITIAMYVPCVCVVYICTYHAVLRLHNIVQYCTDKMRWETKYNRSEYHV